MRYLHGMLLVSSLLAGAPAIAAAVGSTQATSDISVNGAPQYTIPIRMTEGVNGLTPRLAISYAAGDIGMYYRMAVSGPEFRGALSP